MPKKKKEKVVLLDRRVLGVNVVSGGVALPHAYVNYQEYYSDGSSKVVRGFTVFALPSNDGDKNEDLGRPDLLSHILSCTILLADIQRVCEKADKKRMKKVIKY